MDMAARLPLQSNQKKIRVPSGGRTVLLDLLYSPLHEKFPSRQRAPARTHLGHLLGGTASHGNAPKIGHLETNDSVGSEPIKASKETWKASICFICKRQSDRTFIIAESRASTIHPIIKSVSHSCVAVICNVMMIIIIITESYIDPSASSKPRLQPNEHL